MDGHSVCGSHIARCFHTRFLKLLRPWTVGGFIDEELEVSENTYSKGVLQQDRESELGPIDSKSILSPLPVGQLGGRAFSHVLREWREGSCEAKAKLLQGQIA